MHHLSPLSRRKGTITCRSEGCQDLVRFFALLRIKPHAPPLVRVPVNSFEFQPCDRSPQVVHLTGYLRHIRLAHMPSVHRLGLGLPGYLIPFAPPAFVFQCQDQSTQSEDIIDRFSIRRAYQRAAFAIGIPRDIHAFYRYTASSTLPSCPQAQ